MSLAAVQTSSNLVELKKRTSSLLAISLSLSKAVLNDTGGVKTGAEAIANAADEASWWKRGLMGSCVTSDHTSGGTIKERRGTRGH